MSETSWTLYVCPEHGPLSEREAEDYTLEGHDGTFYGSGPDGDPYTGEFYCGLDGRYTRSGDSCGEKLVEVRVENPFVGSLRDREGGD